MADNVEWRNGGNGASTELFVNGEKRGYIICVDDRPNYFAYANGIPGLDDSTHAFIAEAIGEDAIKAKLLAWLKL